MTKMVRKFYMGREIAQVMGPGGIPGLDRPERDDQEKPSIVLDALKLRQSDCPSSGHITNIRWASWCVSVCRPTLLLISLSP